MRSIIRVVLVIVCLVLVFTGPSAWATIRRAPGAWVFGPKTVWTDGTTSPVFHPLSDPLASRSVQNARVSIELDQDISGLCKIRPALRYGSDGVTWDGDALIDSTYKTSAGITYGTTFVDLTGLGTAKTWVQFGVQVANESGSAVNLCNATVMVEPKEQ